MIKSAGAVFAGFAAWSLLWIAGNAAARSVWPDAFDSTGMTTDNGLLVGFLIYSVVLSVVSGLLTGSVAGRSRIAHGSVTGLLLLVVGIGVQSSIWDAMPLWYHLPFLVAILPATLIGARLAGGGTASVAGKATPA